MKKDIFSNWTLIRGLRLAIGLAILIQSIYSGDIAFSLAGLFFAGLAILNVGCCGSAACSIPSNKAVSDNDEVPFHKVL